MRSDISLEELLKLALSPMGMVVVVGAIVGLAAFEVLLVYSIFKKKRRARGPMGPDVPYNESGEPGSDAKF